MKLMTPLVILTSAYAVPSKAFLKDSKLSPLTHESLRRTIERRYNPLNTNVDGTPFVWLPLDEYKGTTFFEY